MASTYLYLRVPDLTEHLSEYRAPKLQNEYINIDPAQFYFILQQGCKPRSWGDTDNLEFVPITILLLLPTK